MIIDWHPTHPVDYSYIGLEDIKEFYKKEGWELRGDINLVLKDNDLLVTGYWLGGKKRSEIARLIERSVTRVNQCLDDATYELYRYYQFNKFIKEGYDLQLAPIEILKIASLFHYSGVGRDVFWSLKNLGINIAHDFEDYSSEELLRIRNMGTKKLENIDLALREAGMQLR